MRGQSTALSVDMAMHVDASETQLESSETGGHAPEQDLDDDAVVNVGDKLLSALSLEVATSLGQALAATRRKQDGRWACPLCPFRSLPPRSLLAEHIRGQHRRGKRLSAVAPSSFA